ncbi:MAG: hypothetical protein H6699_08065 [Myxococcales bacterium]|nr:hypothetical protein [Myxococcales bacterium]
MTQRSRLLIRGAAPLALSALALLACKEEAPVENGAWPPPVTNLLAAPSTLGIHQVTGEIPETPAGEILGWLIDSLNVHPENLTADGVTAKFASSVLDGTSAADLATQLADSARNRPFALVGFNAPTRSNRLVAIIGSAADGYRQLTIETDPSGRASVLQFTPVGPPSNEAPPEPAPPEPPAAPADGSGAPADGSGAAAPAEGSAAAPQ